MSAMRPGAAVVDEHEEDDRQRADDHRGLGLVDRVRAERRADLGLEGLAQRRRQRAGAQHGDQVLGLLLQL